ncbi:MAG: ABC transporter ATP-binding protein, partial [Plesiomonas shigelloides]
MMGAVSASDTADAVPKTIIDTVIDTQGMTRRFGAFTAVDNLNLHIRRGEIFGFLGPNGCGKSTTIRMLTGLLSPSEGSVQVLGQSLPQGGERVRTRIGYMTQKFSLYDDLTVSENLHFIGEVYGLRGAVRKARVAELCRQYELEALQRRLAGSLSGGQKQRLALAAAVIHQPELLFLDEPTAAVDPQNRREFWEQLFDLSAAGTTILVATHYMDEAERCHRIGIMQDGRMRLTGAPAQLMSEMGGAVFEVDGAHLRQLKLYLLGITS